MVNHQRVSKTLVQGDTVVCTVVTSNYISYAEVLLSSVKSLHPDLDLIVLFVDDINRELIESQSRSFKHIFAKDLTNLPNRLHFSAKYDALELSIAIKPYFFEYLFEKMGVKKLIFFDSDCLVFDKLDEILQLLENSFIVLTPHILQTVSNETRPNDVDFLRLGVFNLGFIAISIYGEWEKFLSWWKNMCYSNCLKRQEKGVFLDQKFIDLAPCFFDKIAILRDGSYNVAWWNVSQRNIVVENDSYLVDGRNLKFFHFSGFKVGTWDTLTRHLKSYNQSNLDYSVIDIYKMYEKKILSASYLETKNWAYEFSDFSDGVPFTYHLRNCLRENDPEGTRWPNPWLIESEQNSFRWWALTSKKNGLLSPFLETVHSLYDEIQKKFDITKKEEQVSFLAWILTNPPQLEIPSYYVEVMRKEFKNNFPKILPTNLIIDIHPIPLTERCECGKRKPGVFD